MKARVAAIALVFVIILSGCGEKKLSENIQQNVEKAKVEAEGAGAGVKDKVDNSVAADLVQYFQEVAKLTPLEESALKSFGEVTGTNAKNDTETFMVISEKVTPVYRDFVSKLENIRPKTSEVRDVHDLYIRAANKQFAAFSQLSTNNASANIGQINQNLADARADMRKVQDKFQELSSKYITK